MVTARAYDDIVAVVDHLPTGSRVALVDCPLDTDGAERPSPESTVAIQEIVAGRNASPRAFYRIITVAQGIIFLSIWDIIPES